MSQQVEKMTLETRAYKRAVRKPSLFPFPFYLFILKSRERTGDIDYPAGIRGGNSRMEIACSWAHRHVRE